MLENEKKGEKLEKITWFLKGQGRIRIRIRIRKFITDPDPDPRGQKNTDPYGSGSGSGSGSETLLKILSYFGKSKNQQNLFLIKAFFRGLNFYFWKLHMLLEKLFLTLSGNKKMHSKMPFLLLTINFHLGLMHWLKM